MGKFLQFGTIFDANFWPMYLFPVQSYIEKPIHESLDPSDDWKVHSAAAVCIESSYQMPSRRGRLGRSLPDKAAPPAIVVELQLALLHLAVLQLRTPYENGLHGDEK